MPVSLPRVPISFYFLIDLKEMPIDEYIKQLLPESKSTYTVMPLKVILLSLFPVWKWDRGQLSFKAKEIECASCDAENC